MQTLIRIVIAVIGLLGLAAAANFWFQPELAAQGVGLTVADMRGLATVRADLAGFFGASGVFALLAAWRSDARWTLPVIVLMSFALLGRLITVATGTVNPPVSLPPMLIEAVVIAIFFFAHRALSTK